MRRKTWPESVPESHQARSMVELFRPPGAQAPAAAPAHGPLAPQPLPCDFQVNVLPPDAPPPVYPVAQLRLALRRHRLLFLWYAHPRHRNRRGPLRRVEAA